MSWLNPGYNTNFYHVSRHAEIVVTKDRDVFAFFPDTVTRAPTSGMGIYRDSTRTTPQWTCSVATAVSERLLLWGRVGGTEVASAFRWTPYVDAADTDTQTIKPLREVFAPRVIYDRTSNTLHLWFWTNVQWDYDGSDYDETKIYPIGASNYKGITPSSIAWDSSVAKRVLCYAVGHFEHSWVEGGHVGGYSGSVGPDTRYELVPVFNRPKIVTNYTPSAGEGPGIITDGWHGSRPFAFELVPQMPYDPSTPLITMGVRCGYRARNGLFARCPKGADGGAGWSIDLNEFWTHDYSGGGTATHYIGFQFKSGGYNDELIPEYSSGTYHLEQVLTDTDPFTATVGSEDKYDKVLWVGWVHTASGVIDDYMQLWHGGDENSDVALPDAEYTNGESTSARKTLERNPESSPHMYEFQLRNVQLCKPESYSIPYFASVTAVGGMVPGELQWAAFDTHYTASSTKKSLEVFPVGGSFSTAQVYGFSTAAVDTFLVKRNAGGFEYISYELISGFGNHLFNGIATTGTAEYLNAFTDGGSGAIIGTVTLNWSGGQIIHQPVSGQTQNVTTSGFSGSTTINVRLDPWNKYKHNDLNFTPGTIADTTGLNTDHDYRYMLQGDTHLLSFFGQSIGYGTTLPGFRGGGSLRVELSSCQLVHDGTLANWTVDWRSCILKDTSTLDSVNWTTRYLYNGLGYPSVQWDSLYLYDGSASSYITVDWGNRLLYSFDGGTIRYSVDWANRKLYSDNGTTEVMCWDINPTSGWFLTWDADNTWTLATFKAKPTGDIVLDASTGGLLTLKAKNDTTWDFAGKVDWNIGAASTWDFVSDLTIMPTAANGGDLNLGGVAGSIKPWKFINIMAVDDITLSAGGAGDLFLGVNALSNGFLNIYFNGVAGVDQTAFTIEDVNGKKVTLAFTKGGCTTCTVA